MANGLAPANNIVRLATGQEFDIDRYGDYPLYSSVYLCNGTQVKLRCFNYRIGENIPGPNVQATELDTNLDKQASGLGYSEEMLVWAIAWQFPHDTPTAPANPDIGLANDLINICDFTYYTFEMNGKVYAEGTLDAFPFPGGLYVESQLNNAEYVNNGMPMSGALKPLALPIHITGKASIVSVLQFPRGALALANSASLAVAYRCRNWLFGIRGRYEGTTKGQ